MILSPPFSLFFQSGIFVTWIVDFNSLQIFFDVLFSISIFLLCLGRFPYLYFLKFLLSFTFALSFWKICFSKSYVHVLSFHPLLKKWCLVLEAFSTETSCVPSLEKTSPVFCQVGIGAILLPEVGKQIWGTDSCLNWISACPLHSPSFLETPLLCAANLWFSAWLKILLFFSIYIQLLQFGFSSPGLSILLGLSHIIIIKETQILL